MQPEALAEIVALAIKQALAPLVQRLALLEQSTTKDQATAGALLAVHEVNGLRERVAVLETRAPMPGPMGPAGLDGKDGHDGLGFGDLTLDHDGERTVIVRAVNGERTKDVGRAIFPVPIYRGVWRTDAPYTAGDVVTFGGSGWIAKKETSTQPESAAGAAFWQLFVKRGGK